jgi:hypothetical protein
LKNNTEDYKTTASLKPGADPYSIPISYKGDVLIYPGEYKDEKNEIAYNRHSFKISMLLLKLFLKII